MISGRPRSESQSRRSQSGSVAIEFGLSLLILFPLVAGTIEVGLAVYQDMQVNAAVESGALYAMANGWNQAGITSAVQQTFGAVHPDQVTNVQALPAPTHFCGCPN